MRHAINSAVNFYNAGVVTRDRRIVSWPYVANRLVGEFRICRKLTLALFFMVSCSWHKIKCHIGLRLIATRVARFFLECT
jgi:hypothetical protein